VSRTWKAVPSVRSRPSPRAASCRSAHTNTEPQPVSSRQHGEGAIQRQQAGWFAQESLRTQQKSREDCTLPSGRRRSAHAAGAQGRSRTAGRARPNTPPVYNQAGVHAATQSTIAREQDSAGQNRGEHCIHAATVTQHRTLRVNSGNSAPRREAPRCP
jgi:hypothetical protein